MFSFPKVTAAMDEKILKKSPSQSYEKTYKGKSKWQNVPRSFGVMSSRAVRLSAYLGQVPDEGSNDAPSKTVAIDRFDVLENIVNLKYKDLTQWRELKSKGKLNDFKVRVRYVIRKDHSNGSVSSRSSSSSDDDSDTKRVVASEKIENVLKDTKIGVESDLCIENWHIRSLFSGL